MTQLFSINHDSLRSVRIDLDQHATKTFVVTPLFLQLLQRALAARPVGSPGRAMSIVGPYGTGKSASALALAQLLAGCAPDALRSRIPDGLMPEPRSPFPTLMIQGHYGSLAHSVVEALVTRHPTSANQLREPSGHANLPAIAEVIGSIADAEGGLVLLIDELGKFLEYSLAQSETDDIFLLQLLAETAVRNASPLWVITIMHQGLERYASRSLAVQRDELSKVQGRFEEFPFLQPASDVVRIIGGIIQPVDSAPTEPLYRQVRERAKGAWDFGLAAPGTAQAEFVSALVRCTPLDPITALALGPLSRRLSQNERSVFAFLTSFEPKGLRDFLENDYNELYTLDKLYDYIAGAFGGALYTGPQSQRWAQVETALAHFNSPEDLSCRVLKAIGVLYLLGEQEKLKPTPEILSLVYGEAALTALQVLVKRSLVVYRRFSNTYRIWDGSDFDLESNLEKAKAQLPDVAVASLLSEVLPPRPIVAKAHSFRLGCLRWFDTVYADVSNPEPPPPVMRPRLIYVLELAGFSHEDIRYSSDPYDVSIRLRLPSLVADAATELWTLRWVETNTPELAMDPVARREVAHRIAEVDTILVKLFRQVLGAGSSLEIHWKGSVERTPARELNHALSSICDQLYSASPAIPNELINRDNLSSSATAARRDLLQRIIERKSEKDLGLEGFPPQRAMYLAILELGDMHQETQDGWVLQEPGKGTPWYDVWQAISVATADELGIEISALWDKLHAPPYGLSHGVLPVITLIFLLVNSHQVALYEGGQFIPEVTIPVVERLIKHPGHYRIHRINLAGARSAVFSVFGELGLTSKSAASRGYVLSVVRPLLIFASKLPPYTRNSKALSEKSINVREALLTATDPFALLYETLPMACDIDAISDSSPRSQVEAFGQELVSSIRELASHYEALLRTLTKGLAEGLSVDTNLPLASIRARWVESLRRVDSWIHQDRDRSIAIRLLDSSLTDDPWLESVGAVFVGRLPAAWYDQDVEVFRTEVLRYSMQVRHLTAFVIASHQQSDDATIGVAALIRDKTEEFVTINLRESVLEQARRILRRWASEVPEREILSAVAWAIMTEFSELSLKGGH